MRRNGAQNYKLKILFSFFLFWFSPVFGNEQTFLYKEQFDTLLSYLENTHWNESGDWGGDSMGDASWFAAALFFEMGTDENKPDYIKKAQATLLWEEKLFDAFYKDYTSGKIPEKIVETLGGLPALFYGYQFTKSAETKARLEKGLDLACSLVRKPPPIITENLGVDPVVMLGGVLSFSSLFYLETGEEKYKKCAQELMEIANVVYWDEDEKDYGELWDWSAGTMLAALSGMYRITKDEFYLKRRDELLGTAIQKLWDKENGGFVSKHFELSRAKALSGNNLFVTAMIEWYKITKDEKYLNYAKKTLDFIFSPALYDGTFPYHHWTKEEGRAKVFCTGCHLHTLLNIYELNKALKN